MPSTSKRADKFPTFHLSQLLTLTLGAISTTFYIMKIYKEWLQANGFRFEEKPYGLVFKYQGATLIIMNPDNDSQYLRITMPNIYECSQKNILQTLTAINKVNLSLKAATVVLHNDNSVWVNVEMFIDSTPDLDDFMTRILDILIEGRIRFSTYIEE